MHEEKESKEALRDGGGVTVTVLASHFVNSGKDQYLEGAILCHNLDVIFPGSVLEMQKGRERENSICWYILQTPEA